MAKQQTQVTVLPKTEAKPLPRYHFPRECLDQDYFCLLGTGQRMSASMDLGMLANDKFVSPLQYLLRQLSQDGFNVDACEAELTAMREHICNEAANLQGLTKIVDGMLNRRPSVAMAELWLREREKKRLDDRMRKRMAQKYPHAFMKYD